MNRNRTLLSANLDFVLPQSRRLDDLPLENHTDLAGPARLSVARRRCIMMRAAGMRSHSAWEGFDMAHLEGPEGQPPSAWVWSHYRGVQPGDAPAAVEQPPASAASAPAAAPVAAAQHSSLIGIGLAAAVIIIAGLTWLFTTRPAAGPNTTEEPPAATGTETAPQKSEAAPPAAEPVAAPAATPAAAPPEAKPATPAAASPPRVKKKKPHQG
jgi:cytoskeletal protein RodZ